MCGLAFPKTRWWSSATTSTTTISPAPVNIQGRHGSAHLAFAKEIGTANQAAVIMTIDKLSLRS